MFFKGALVKEKIWVKIFPIAFFHFLHANIVSGFFTTCSHQHDKHADIVLSVEPPLSYIGMCQVLSMFSDLFGIRHTDDADFY